MNKRDVGNHGEKMCLQYFLENTVSHAFIYLFHIIQNTQEMAPRQFG